MWRILKCWPEMVQCIDDSRRFSQYHKIIYPCVWKWVFHDNSWSAAVHDIAFFTTGSTFTSIPSFADVPVVLAVLLLLSFLLLVTVMQLLLYLLLIVAGVTDIACCCCHSCCYWCRLSSWFLHCWRHPCYCWLTWGCCWCSCCCFMPAVAGEVPVDPSISILACDKLDYQATGPQLSDSYFFRYQTSAVTKIGLVNSRNYHLIGYWSIYRIFEYRTHKETFGCPALVKHGTLPFFGCLVVKDGVIVMDGVVVKSAYTQSHLPSQYLNIIGPSWQPVVQ